MKEGVRIFNPSLRKCLRTDWSMHGKGFILTQKHCRCHGERVTCCKEGRKKVFAGSKFNNPAERKYSAVEGECLAVVRALYMARHFVLGCKNLIISTDHKPLLKILGDQSLEEIHNPKLLNLKEKTLRFHLHFPN